MNRNTLIVIACVLLGGVMAVAGFEPDMLDGIQAEFFEAMTKTGSGSASE